MSAHNENPFNIKNKCIILTGANGFLGQGYMKALSEAGATVVAWDKQGVFKKSSPFIYPMHVDVTDESQVANAVEEILEKHGHIDGLINNAAMNPKVGSNESNDLFAPYEEYSIDLFRKEIDTNLTSMMITMKHVAPIMMRQKSGSIVNIASEVSTIAHNHEVYATEGKYKSPAYTASKAAVLGLTRQWAARLGVYNVRVNAVSIGGVAKENMPKDFMERFGAATMLKRMAHLGEYNASMIYLLSEASSFMTGANLTLDGGKSAW